MKNKIKTDKRNVALRIASIVLLSISLIAIIFPIYWMILTSMKDSSAANKTPPDLRLTVKDKYDIIIDSSGREYVYETFKKDSVVIIWMLYDSQKNTNLGDIKVNWVVDGKLKATTEFAESNFRRIRNNVFSATNLSVLLLNADAYYEACVDEMAKKNAFKTDLDKAFNLSSSSKAHEDKFRDYINSLTITDRNGENERYYFSFENIASTVKTSKYYKGILDNYSYAYSYFMKENVTFIKIMFNSLIIAVAAILFQWVFTSTAAFAVAKILGKKLGNIITLIFVATMMIPSIVYIIPLYSMVAKYNFTDRLMAVVLPGVSNAVAFVLFKGFFYGIPKDMYEAAKIDGANEGQIFIKLYAPMSLSVYGVIALLTFTGNWNDLMWPSMILKSTAAQTFPIIIQRMLGSVVNGATDYPMALAMSAMAMLPTLLIFMIFQKQLSKGLVFEGIKG